MELNDIIKGLDNLSSKQEDKIEKAKYIKREKKGDKWVYTYNESQGKGGSGEKKDESIEGKIKAMDNKIISEISKNKDITIREMRQKLFDVRSQDTMTVTIEDKNGDKKDFTIRELRNKLFEAKQQDHPANIKSISVKQESQKEPDKKEDVEKIKKDVKLLNHQFYKIGKVLSEGGSRKQFINNDIKELGNIMRRNNISKEAFSKVKKDYSELGRLNLNFDNLMKNS